MNAFEKESLTREYFIPYKIVSLWDMLQIYGNHLSSFSGMLHAIARVIDMRMKQGLTDFVLDQAPHIKIFRNQFSEWPKVLRGMGLCTSSKYLDLVFKLLDMPLIPCKDLVSGLDKVSESMMFELEDKLMFMLHQEEDAKYYNIKDTFLGRHITAAVPDLIRDAAEAGKCFSLERYTGCVFHLMRIAEFMNQLFAKKLEITEIESKRGPIPINDADWRTIYDHINKHVNGGRNSKPLSDKRLREECNNLLSIVGPLREVRNPLMHAPGDFYTRENALTYINCISSFIKQFFEVFPTD